MPTAQDTMPLLFTPPDLRGLRPRNRVVISPMCQYSATDGVANDWHFAHLAKFAIGGAGIVFTEAAAVGPEGRITHGDIGIWSDEQAEALGRVSRFLKDQGALPAIQLAHAGRKAAVQRPWQGSGPLTETDFARGDKPWPVVGPSATPVDDGWLTPHQLSAAEIGGLCTAFAAAARRALDAGFEVLEIHGAHGYLIHSFLSPVSNCRNDAYGGDRGGRMRFALEVTAAVRAVWPERLPLFFRVSAVDGVEGGWTIEDSVALAGALKERGVDVIDCSSGGIGGPVTALRAPREPGFQVPYAARIRRDVGIMTQAVGMITEPDHAEAILQAGDADLIAIAREALYNPFWPLHALRALKADPEFGDWPVQYGWWLARRESAMAAARA